MGLAEVLDGLPVPELVGGAGLAAALVPVDDGLPDPEPGLGLPVLLAAGGGVGLGVPAWRGDSV
ncbi:hypothetical protein GCM10010112_34740 [Actinoplanes lobatus]|uniref:Uncharacterized protein n=1 Tax=Actinoplanes lobatus TaxID=113568 RepID=A0ABQ4AT26_9ACTN|nr:hypothetical protein GCM10010112_34740 [Actinoplanes lobatus]GIE44166.1 hypothetical protein Alo02nite_70640 [Actinoplanes lobatus]